MAIFEIVEFNQAKATAKQMQLIDTIAMHDQHGFSFFDYGLDEASCGNSDEVYEHMVRNFGGTAKSWGSVVGRMNKYGLTSRTDDGFAYLEWSDEFAEILEARRAELLAELQGDKPSFERTESHPLAQYTGRQIMFMRALREELLRKDNGVVEQVTTEGVYGILVEDNPGTTSRSWSSVGSSLSRKTQSFATDTYSKFFIISNEALVREFQV